jgi:hypothetical protein
MPLQHLSLLSCSHSGRGVESPLCNGDVISLLTWCLVCRYACSRPDRHRRSSPWRRWNTNWQSALQASLLLVNRIRIGECLDWTLDLVLSEPWLETQHTVSRHSLQCPYVQCLTHPRSRQPRACPLTHRYCCTFQGGRDNDYPAIHQTADSGAGPLDRPRRDLGDRCERFRRSNHAH